MAAAAAGASPFDATTFAARFRDTVRLLLPSVASLEMSIAGLNRRLGSPRKDYSKNRLNSGFLQLGDGTTMLLDETALHPGTLQTNGVCNIQALRKLVAFQQVTYDFEYVVWHDDKDERE
jgi:hypothetical protein